MTAKRTLAPGFRLLLASEATVTALVSTRIYFARLPQQPTYPAITLELVDRNPHNALASWPALVWSKVRVRSWGTTYAEATELAQAVQRAINGTKATVAGHTYFRSIVAEGMQDDYAPEVEAYGIQQDYRIWHYYQPTVTQLASEDLTAQAFLSPTTLVQTHRLTTEDLTAEAFLEAGLVVPLGIEATFTTSHGNGALLPQPEDEVEVADTAVLTDTAMLPQPEDEVEVADTAVLTDTAMLPQPEDEVSFTTTVYDDGAP